MAVPLTTLFHEPSHCAERPYTSWTVFAQDPSATYYLQDKDGPGDGTNSACYPPNFSSLHGRAQAIYSPGICPLGYLVADSGVDGDQHSSVCCPTTATHYLTRVAMCINTGGDTPSLTIVNGSTTATITSGAAANWAIRVQWASSDLDLFTPLSAPVLPTASATHSSPAASRTPTPRTSRATQTVTQTASKSKASTSAHTSAPAASTTSDTSQHSASKLSAGTSAGIAVGATIIVLAIAGILAWAILRKRRSWRATKPQDHSGNSNVYNPYFRQGIKHELDGDQYVEAPGHPAIYEVHGS